MYVKQLCSRDLVSARTNATLADVAALMCRHRVGTVVVTRQSAGRPEAIGIITDRDIVRAQLERTADLSRLNVEDVMSRDLLVLDENVSIEEAIQRLRARSVRRAPVVTRDGMLVGLVSVDDLVAELARRFGALARLLERQTAREADRAVVYAPLEPAATSSGTAQPRQHP